MEVCRDQSQRSEDMEQDPWLNPQASTSTATPNQHYTPSQVAPAWHNHHEHPLVLEVALAISSSLSICDDQSPPQPQQLSCSVAKGKATPEQQLPTTSVATSDTGKVSDVRKLKRRFSETSQSEQHKTSKEAPAEASSSTATATPQRKRTWANFVASYTGSRTPYTGSPERKKRKMTVMDSLSEAQTEAPSTEAKINPQRKRMWVTFVASHPGLRSPFSGSPERKKRKMSLLLDLKEAEAPSTITPQSKRTWATFVASHPESRTPCSPERKKRKMEVMDSSSEAQTEAPSTEAKIKPQRKRTWATFVASHPGLRTPCSPERKKRKMEVMDSSSEAQTEAPSTEAKIKPQRKRTWATFVALHPGLRTPCSPERKKRKMEVMDSSSEAQTEAPSTEAKIKPQRKRTWATFVALHPGLRTPCSPERKKRKMEVMDSSSETQTEAPSTEAKIKPQRKRTWATFVASHPGLRTPCSPERKKRKMEVMDSSSEAQTEAPSTEAKIKPQRKRTWATFVALHPGLRTPCSPERKKRKMSQSHDSNKAPTDESETQKKRKRQDSNQALSSEAKNPEIIEKYPDCSSPKRKKKEKDPLR
ncbi:uncharacterized protein LOC117254553 [Epinephelus lanceolatus]